MRLLRLGVTSKPCKKNCRSTAKNSGFFDDIQGCLVQGEAASFLRLGRIAGGTHSRLQAFNHHASLSLRHCRPKSFASLAAVLPDTEAARTHAIDLATNIAKHTLETPANAVRVIDEEGSVLFRVPIRRRPSSEYKTGAARRIVSPPATLRHDS